MTIHVDVVSAEKEIFSGLAEMVFVPAVHGEVGITPRHAPFLSSMRPGQVRVRISPGHEALFYVSGGMLEIQPHLVTILADSALHAEDLDEILALTNKWRAEKALAEKQADIDYAKVHAQLMEALAQIQTIKEVRKRRRPSTAEIAEEPGSIDKPN